MLFNSYPFLLAFLPLTFTGYFLIGRVSHRAALGWLTFASIFFYGYWSVRSLPILLGSICVNYTLGLLLADRHRQGRAALLGIALGANLLLIGYYKYVDFFILNSNTMLGLFGFHSLPYLHVLLPIGISFFTFTQIAFLIDSYQGKVLERDFLSYALFVTYFPHLIAGPIIHHKQVMPQLADPRNFSIDAGKIQIGTVVFVIGLGKKLLLADPLGVFVDKVFNVVQGDQVPEVLISWLGAVSYTFQMYFDFSGYSEMAVGLSLLFGIWLPFNFNAPLRATSIIEFWQRWHMSLTKYINEYLYVPLTLKFVRMSMDKPSVARVLYSLVIPTMTTMVIVGLWHGANWTFVLFGVLHGLFLVINHLWRKRRFLIRPKHTPAAVPALVASWLLTFTGVTVALAMFRAGNVHQGLLIYQGMLGGGGLNISEAGVYFTQLIKLPFLLTLAFMIVLLSPSSPELAKRLSAQQQSQSEPTATMRFPPRQALYAVAVGLLLSVCILALGRPTPFLYFQF
jgi:alginate O-acetyltransferase complex protein AlgI